MKSILYSDESDVENGLEFRSRVVRHVFRRAKRRACEGREIKARASSVRTSDKTTAMRVKILRYYVLNCFKSVTGFFFVFFFLDPLFAENDSQ